MKELNVRDASQHVEVTKVFFFVVELWKQAVTFKVCLKRTSVFSSLLFKLLA